MTRLVWFCVRFTFCSVLALGFTLQVGAIPTVTQKVMITAPSHYAVAAGEKVARKGGNIVDVAVTVALTLSVTGPYFASLGGGGFALVKMDKKVEALDFRETAPKATGPEFYISKDPMASRTGGAAVGVPGIPAGLWELHKKHGKLHWSQLFDQAIELANKGFEVSGEWHEDTEYAAKKFNDAGKKYFLVKGTAPKPGTLHKQPQLANVLREMRNRGPVAFYEGLVAQDIVASVKKAGGVISLADLKSYKPRWLEPVHTSFQGHEVYIMPPPSSGGVVIQSALQLMELVDLHKQTPLSADELHYIAEIQKVSFRGRRLLGDPAFHKNPTDMLLKPSYLKGWAKKLNTKKTVAVKPFEESDLRPVQESTETTHFTVMNHLGQAVSVTVTLNGTYGSGVVSEKFGIALNNEMDDFTTRPGEPNMFGLIQGAGNKVEPGKRPLSSMSPTIVLKDGKAVLALGAPGGPRIINGVLQVLYRTLVNGWNMDEAIQAGRVHHQFEPDLLFVDDKRISPDTLELLRKKGHTIKLSSIARVNGVRLRDDGLLEGAYDSRGEGAAGGF